MTLLRRYAWAPPLLWALEGCSGPASAAPVASSSSLQAQTTAAANPAVTVTLNDVPLSEEMVEAQLLCTTSLSYRPCGLVAPGDTVNCFLLCQGQIGAGATSLLAQAVQECAGRPAEPADAGSSSCEFTVPDDSPVDVAQLRATCNARCRELQEDGGGVSPPRP